jgi:hypothetical protein
VGIQTSAFLFALCGIIFTISNRATGTAYITSMIMSFLLGLIFSNISSRIWHS